ncbi:MAG: hypothetical protein AMS27_15470 [Bacteroides sp. SM23_62_1]|nr:MAG: hypothetical protein AMS27_15470 [Bacteroides sp. SM23_62_1]
MIDKQNRVLLSFLGDISFNDEYVTLFNRGEDPFSEIKHFLRESDFVIGNLECVAKGDEGEFMLREPRLKTEVNTLHYLNNLNIKLVTLAHNHIYDNLFDGYKKTTVFLDQNKIFRIGAGYTAEEARKPLIVEMNNIRFGFFNYVSQDTNPILPENSPVSLNMLKKEVIIEDLKQNRNLDYLILLLHWGGIMEYGLYPHFNQCKLARNLIDEGADMIIGHHSHTLQPYEKYKQKYIFYSLGNFCFANIIYDNRVKKVDYNKFSESVIVQVYFEKDHYHIDLIPIANRKLRIRTELKIINKLKRRNFMFKILFAAKPLWYLYYFFHRFVYPVIFQLGRKEERSIMQRLVQLNQQKIKNLFSK